MEKTILAAIALMVATMPMTFAAPAPRSHAATSVSVNTARRHKKHHARKHLRKNAKSFHSTSAAAPMQR